MTKAPAAYTDSDSGPVDLGLAEHPGREIVEPTPGRTMFSLFGLGHKLYGDVCGASTALRERHRSATPGPGGRVTARSR